MSWKQAEVDVYKREFKKIKNEYQADNMTLSSR